MNFPPGGADWREKVLYLVYARVGEVATGGLCDQGGHRGVGQRGGLKSFSSHCRCLAGWFVWHRGILEAVGW